MKRTINGVVLGLVFAAVPAAAQPADFAGIDVKGAPRVIVTDRSGQETSGRLVGWTASSVVLDTNGARRTYLPDEAVRIDLRGDSLKNGAMIGAAVGALAGLSLGCPTAGSRGEGCSAERATFVLASAAMYAAIGAGIDALIPGRTRLWHSGSPQKSAGGLTIDVSPRERRASVGWRFQTPNP